MFLPINAQLFDASFRFGDGAARSRVTIEIRLPISSDQFLFFHANVVPADIPLQHGLDVFRSFQMTIGFSSDSLTILTPPCLLPMTYNRVQAHVFAEQGTPN